MIKSWKKPVAAVSAFAVASSMCLGGATAAFAEQPWATDEASSVTAASSARVNSYLDNYLTTYGVRAGSAGADFMGIANTNFDFTGGTASQTTQFNYEENNSYTMTSKQTSLQALNIWGNAAINEDVNPFYQNLLYNYLHNSSSATSYAATTWMSNPESSSWGDSNNQASTRVKDGSATIAGLEYDPDILYGASKTGGWSNYKTVSDSGVQATNFYKYMTGDGKSGYTVSVDDFANNDSTNLWSQIYSMEQLASLADSKTKSVRYNGGSSTASAVDYEKAIRGQLLYIASKIDAGAKKKTVAYLYSIDENGTAYFFTPEASGLLVGDDTDMAGKSSEVSANDDGSIKTEGAVADDNYAANNSTINMGYMATLPFVTNTFKNGTTVEGGINMVVEDIYKSNPAVSVSSDATSALADVNVIIYNSTTATSLAGKSGGKNSSGIGTAGALTDASVLEWAKAHGYAGTSSTVIAGDDFGTSNNQPISASESYASGTAPRLYCQRNYTCDKDTRAAWAFSKVFPEYYDNNQDATYGYWLEKVYHVQTNQVATVAKNMTVNPGTVTYSSTVSDMVETNAQTGYDWWINTGSKKSEWSQYAYYNGSSRASIYDGQSTSEEPSNRIGIFQPSAAWTAAVNTPAAKKSQTIKVAKSTVKVKRGKSTTVKVSGAETALVASSSSKYVTAKASGTTKVKITVKKGAKKGKTYKVKVYAKASSDYAKSATKTIKVKVK